MALPGFCQWFKRMILERNAGPVNPMWHRLPTDEESNTAQDTRATMLHPQAVFDYTAVWKETRL